ncbi:hypothetical protein A3J03_04835 [Candidatus Uhrbacteria bacterium RIFCSPLOWO2_02_FULL_46_25]|nr:MAG: hypothetical protein A3D58_03060 [Candidatus Uhrbacteria bacterium RIFCSPHIGHO2_02_FULL_46_47]OGL85379.1 MAG: hypothetical protein A3J03_04835 [Candidatus Uhrbacteria bacterium RIFCSPLOWO2_02_FULL_46_25]
MFSAWKGSDGQIHLGDFPKSIRTVPPSEGVRLARELLGAYMQWQADSDSATTTAAIAAEHELKVNLKTDCVRAVGQANLPSKSGEEWDLDPESPLPEGVSIVAPADEQSPYCLSMDLSKQAEEGQWSAGPLPDFEVICRCRARKSGKEAISLHRVRVQPKVQLDFKMFSKRVMGIMNRVGGLPPLPGLDLQQRLNVFAELTRSAKTLEELCDAATDALLEPIACGLMADYDSATIFVSAGSTPGRQGHERVYVALRSILREVATALAQPIPELPDLDKPVDSTSTVVANGGLARLRAAIQGPRTGDRVFWTIRAGKRDALQRVVKPAEIVVWGT